LLFIFVATSRKAQEEQGESGTSLQGMLCGMLFRIFHLKLDRITVKSQADEIMQLMLYVLDSSRKSDQSNTIILQEEAFMVIGYCKMLLNNSIKIQ
jgi:hypothetical protein